MGYCMSQNESKFHIRAADKDLALRAIKALMIDKKGPFHWVDTATVKSSQNLFLHATLEGDRSIVITCKNVISHGVLPGS